MAEFLIESPHTKEECMEAMKEIAEMGKEHLEMYKWGCSAGNHTGWAFVEAENEEEVKEMIPEDLQKKAKITPVETLSEEEITEMHGEDEEGSEET